jgi:hypothetical protein
MENLVKQKSEIEKHEAIAKTNAEWKQRYDSLQVFTFNDAYPSADNLNIKALVKARPNATKTLLFHIITDLCRSFNILNTMSAEQIMHCVQDVVYDFPDLTIRDFKLFSRMASAGSFGKSFNRIDKAVIYEWLNLYCDAQFKHIENEHINSRHQYTDFTAMPEQLRDTFSEAFKNAEAVKKEEPKSTPRELSETDKMIQAWMKEFDATFKEQTKGLKPPALKMIVYPGEKFPIDVTKFVEIKLMEATS